MTQGVENPLNLFLKETEKDQNSILNKYMKTFKIKSMRNDYLSYINHFLQEAGQPRRSYKDKQIEINDRSKKGVTKPTRERYKKDVEDFVLFYAFENQKRKRRHFKKR